MGFPATESGIELKILKYLFSEADADFFTNTLDEVLSEDAAQPRG